MNLAERLKYESAYQQGVRAYDAYKHISDNPFPYEGYYQPEHSEWVNG